jgi:hypothetical protein
VTSAKFPQAAPFHPAALVEFAIQKEPLLKRSGSFCYEVMVFIEVKKKMIKTNSFVLAAMLTMIIFQGCNSSNKANEALIQAASKGDVAAVQTAISQGADINYKDAAARDLTPLMAAASSGHAEVVKVLLGQRC